MKVEIKAVKDINKRKIIIVDNSIKLNIRSPLLELLTTYKNVNHISKIFLVEYVKI